ncbi:MULTISPECIES: nSTAND1 domain-containing NTPase [Saccharothrix]|uniref:nSTAND1 domain-containing NTPase n=1 Tax=Saccharothrix TaxID=2071 RepID=UPI00095A76AE|nr:helix-turn-helix domain-containing protein [Saccharothrix sp. CB00851]OKI32580.1 hypothetical protein A6A25_26040 [Saccharothrix sp. CB00851]
MARPEGPLRAESRELGEFAADLRALRERAGGPTYRRLARDAHYSAAALSEAANGRRLPSLAVTLAYVRACGGDVVAWEGRWREVSERVADANPRTPPTATEAPYTGLAAFQVRDADRFFGRDRVVRELTGLVARRRFAGVFGASGSGKSSVLRAGLVATWSRPSVVLTPGARPVEELAVRIAASTGRDAAALAAEFTSYPENLHLRVRQALVGGDDDLLIVVDQFEEVFTLCQEPAERAAFIAALTTACSAPTSRTRVVLGVRADFLGHCGQYPELVEALRGGQVLLGPMSPDELREAIVSPAAAVGCKVETALVTRLVADAAGQPGVLPLVSHALLETWRRRRGVALTLAGYEEVGGVEHSIARSAEHIYQGMGPVRQEVAKQVFLRLIAVGEGTEDTKRRVARAEVDHHPGSDGHEVLAALAQARLVVLDRDAVELAHEALIRNWPRLRDWIAEDRAGLRVQRMLTEAAHTWEALDRDPGALYRGTRLALVREWVDGTRGPRLTPGEIRFLEASIAADDAVRAGEFRRTRRLRQLVSVMAVLLVLASSAIVVAVRAERSATEQRNIALARKVITHAATLRDADPALSLQLTLAAHRLAPLPETRDALYGAFTKPYATRIAAVRTTAVSPTASLLAVTDDTTVRDVRLVDVSDPHHPANLGVLTGLTDPRVLAFSRDGTWLAGASDEHVAVWRTTNPRQPVLLHRLDDLAVAPTAALAFSPDARYLVAGFVGGAPRAWDLTDGAAPVSVPSPGGASSEVAFLSGHVAAIVSGDRVHAVDLATGTSDVLVDGVGAVTALAVGDEGRLVATAGEDRVVRLWEVADPRGPARQTAALRHGGDVRALALNEDARVLATAGDDRSARLWDVTNRSAPLGAATLNGHFGPVTAVGFAAGGRALVTAGADRSARLTDLTDLPVAHPVTLRSVVVAAGRPLAATVDVEGELRLVDISAPRGPRTAWPLTAHPGPVRAAALSRDGEHLVTAAEDGRVRVWRTTNPAAPDLVGETGRGHVVAFSPKGTHFATGGLDDGTVRLWNVATLARVAELTDPVDPKVPTAALAFDDTGDRLVVTKLGGSVEQWDTTVPLWPERRRRDTLGVTFPTAVASVPGGLVTVEGDGKAVVWREPGPDHDGDRPAPLTSSEPLGSGVRGVAAAGGLLVIAGTDGNLRLYDVSGRPSRPSAVFAGHSSGAGSVAFAPDGHTLVSAGDSVLRFWETDLGAVVDRICATAYPPDQRRAVGGLLPGLAP